MSSIAAGRLVRVGLLALATVTVAACSSDSTAPAAAPAGLEAVAGTTPTATVGRALAAPFVVRVTDGAGRPVSGRAVTWSIVQGGGRLATTAVTDAGGLATATWTPGEAAGDGLVTATVDGRVAYFPVTLVADAPASITMVAGMDQTLEPLGQTPVPFTLRVVDRFGNGVAGAAVTWRVTTTDADDLLLDASEATDGSGTAWAGYRLGAEVGERTVAASVPGAGDVMFTVTAAMADTTVMASRRSR